TREICPTGTQARAGRSTGRRRRQAVRRARRSPPEGTRDPWSSGRSASRDYLTAAAVSRQEAFPCKGSKQGHMLQLRFGETMFRRIDHVAIHVSDLDRSVAFYEARFGFRKYFQHAAGGGMQIAYLKLGDTVLELTHRAEPMKGFHFCLEAEHFDAAV